MVVYVGGRVAEYEDLLTDANRAGESLGIAAFGGGNCTDIDVALGIVQRIEGPLALRAVLTESGLIDTGGRGIGVSALLRVGARARGRQ